ncbi:MAG: glucose-6-phosphate isomerase [Salinibacterium sp.]|nr:glucose-6-phosphate isomerase [Salinibacterium sp.]
MNVSITVSGAAAEAVERIVPQLVSDLVASRITAGDASLGGAEAEEEASKRLGWVEAVSTSRPMVDDIMALGAKLRDDGINHIVLGGMGGSSLAPEVITRTYGVPLTVLDSTDPGQVLAALGHRLATTAVVISSKSGSTVETDSQKRIYEQYFNGAGIDPLDRIIIVTDPGSPLDVSARAAGYRVFNADPNVGGRYSALTAFGLVPSGLAGVDISELLDEAEAALLPLSVDEPENVGLILGAAIAGTRPLRNKLGIVSDGTHILGFGDWAEQLIAESTGKLGKGVLPVVLNTASAELSAGLSDLQIVRLVGDREDTETVAHGEIEIAGTLGAQLLTWQYAVAVAGRILGINPFDQPDVESAKLAARALTDHPSAPQPPAFTVGDIEVRGTANVLDGAHDLETVVQRLLALIASDGYLAVHAYADRVAHPELVAVRDALAARVSRPTTFGWGPRFLHSTGQFHKGGPAVGVFLQIIAVEETDLQIPDRPFTFGELILAQAAGDAAVLAERGRPVLTLTVRRPAQSLPTVVAALS